MSPTPLFSNHSFMFPFRWDYVSSKADKEIFAFSSRTNLADFDRVFTSCNTLKRTPFHIGKNNSKYNEYTYFHDFARKAIYFTGRENEDMSDHDMIYYELDGGKDDYFEIITLVDGNFKLKIENVCIHAYSTGVGVLTYNLSNYEYQNPSEILKINEFGRRIYPQFITDNSLEKVKKSMLAQNIQGQLGKIKFNENFEQYLSNIDTGSSFLPPDHIKKIFGYLGQEHESSERSFVFRREHERKGNIRISKITDDRMFFVCWYGNDTQSRILAKNYEKSDWWYAYIFGDKAWKNIANTKMQNKSIEASTYQRWSNYGTLFGMTRDSFVAVTSSRENLIKNNVPDISIHMQTMYYQMAVISLAQRASVLRFSYEVNLITNALEKGENPSKKIQDLYKNYIQFINKLNFREITSQLQGIEMYEQFHKVMNLDAEIKALDEEISELHSYVSMVESSSLSKIALWFLPLGAIAGLLGTNLLDTENFDFPKMNEINIKGLSWLFGIIIFSFGTSWFLSKRLNKKIK